MKKFDVEITETLQRRVSVEAASQEDAERMVTQAWNNQDYVLDSGDFTGVDFKTVGEHELAETRTMDAVSYTHLPPAGTTKITLPQSGAGQREKSRSITRQTTHLRKETAYERHGA